MATIAIDLAKHYASQQVSVCWEQRDGGYYCEVFEAFPFSSSIKLGDIVEHKGVSYFWLSVEHKPNGSQELQMKRIDY